MRYGIIAFYKNSIYCLQRWELSDWGFIKDHFPKTMYEKHPKYTVDKDIYLFEYTEAQEILKKYKRYTKRKYPEQKFRYDIFRIIKETKIEAIIKVKIRQQLKM